MTGSSTADGSSSFTTWQVPVPTITAGDLVVANVGWGARVQRRHRERAVVREQCDAGEQLHDHDQHAEQLRVWVAEFSGTQSGPPASIGGNCVQYPPTIVSVPAVTTVPNQLAVTVMMASAPTAPATSSQHNPAATIRPTASRWAAA
jgi:hypothetical protein